jgi:hypothetical protein
MLTLLNTTNIYNPIWKEKNNSKCVFGLNLNKIYIFIYMLLWGESNHDCKADTQSIKVNFKFTLLG